MTRDDIWVFQKCIWRCSICATFERCGRYDVSSFSILICSVCQLSWCRIISCNYWQDKWWVYIDFMAAESLRQSSKIKDYFFHTNYLGPELGGMSFKQHHSWSSSKPLYRFSNDELWDSWTIILSHKIFKSLQERIGCGAEDLVKATKACGAKPEAIW